MYCGFVFYFFLVHFYSFQLSIWIWRVSCIEQRGIVVQLQVLNNALFCNVFFNLRSRHVSCVPYVPYHLCDWILNVHPFHSVHHGQEYMYKKIKKIIYYRYLPLVQPSRKILLQDPECTDEDTADNACPRSHRTSCERRVKCHVIKRR